MACAGIATFGPAVELGEDEWRDVIDVNLTGVWHTAKVAVPQLRAAGRGGSIILISSTAASRSAPGLAAYAAAKRGVLALTRTLAAELGPESIRVNAVSPGSTNTDMLHNPQIYDLWAPDVPVGDARYVTGVVLPVDAGTLLR